MRVLVVVLFVSLLLNCRSFKNTDDNHQVLTICNRSDRDVYYQFSDFKGDLFDYNPINNPAVYMLKPHGCQEETDWSFEDVISRRDSNRLTYYFFDAQVLKTVHWDTIRARKMYLDVRHYTKPMLDSLNWRIEFP